MLLLAAIQVLRYPVFSGLFGHESGKWVISGEKIKKIKWSDIFLKDDKKFIILTKVQNNRSKTVDFRGWCKFAPRQKVNVP